MYYIITNKKEGGIIGKWRNTQVDLWPKPMADPSHKVRWKFLVMGKNNIYKGAA